MIFESKYDIGQELWEITLSEMPHESPCPFCHQTYYDRQWNVFDAEQTIRNVIIDGETNACAYSIGTATGLSTGVTEQQIEELYFFTKQEAEEECARRNAVHNEETEIMKEAIAPVLSQMRSEKEVVEASIFDGPTVELGPTDFLKGLRG